MSRRMDGQAHSFLRTPQTDLDELNPTPGLCLNTKMVFPGMAISIIILRPSYLYQGNPYTGKTTSL